ncbi:MULTISPECIES: hypothetical protein [Gammaproteobacteria]|uniref:hypothetical protein n=1 Tax=Gammaproteobacteria TaxID=1236 RepID=UPI0014040F2B|nr:MULTISPECIES: hypothetical protein [Gammaproteobacteria]
MSKLDKEKVLSEFSAAFEAAEGKKPKIEEKSGWFSVDGGKNMRLAKLDEWAKELSGGKKEAAPKKSAAKPAEKKPAAKKPAAKKAAKPAAKKATSKKKSSGGMTAKEVWQKRLEEEKTQSRLPRGF